MAKKSALDKLNHKISVAETNLHSQSVTQESVEQPMEQPVEQPQTLQTEQVYPEQSAQIAPKPEKKEKPKKEKAPKPAKPPKEPSEQKQRKEKPKKKSALDKVQKFVPEESAVEEINAPFEPETTEVSEFSAPEPVQNGGLNNNHTDMDVMPERTKYEFDDEANDILAARKQQRKENRKRIMSRIASVFLVLACIYIIFLIYGTFVTEYTYDENGNIVPQFMSVDEIRELEEFNDFAIQYRQARVIYEEVLRLDYRIGAGIEDPLVIAPEYEKMLESIEQLAIDVQATTVSSKYTQTHSMLLQWVQTDIAVYCQRMSQAISQNNAEYAAQALEYKSIVYNDFSLITGNITTLGQTVNGADISDITSWSPEKYVRENIG